MYNRRICQRRQLRWESMNVANGAKRFAKIFAKNIRKSVGRGQFTANNIAVICVHCGHDMFKQDEAQLNTAFMSFLNLDFANSSAKTLACERCGYIHWFAGSVRRRP